MEELQVVEREGGGWLAVGTTPPGIRIAVEGTDERGARAAFAQASARWGDLDDAAKRRAEAEVPSD